MARELVDEIYIVTARATLPDGRCDESIGAVALGNLQGEARANGIMRTETKAKRRVTLSICGLALLDETEVDSIPGSKGKGTEKESPLTLPSHTPEVWRTWKSPHDASRFESSRTTETVR